MKKILLFALAATILAGCSNNYLDEKIKCKELTDKRIEEMKNDPERYGNSQHTDIQSRYATEIDTCLLKYINMGNNPISTIEDLLGGETISFSQNLYDFCIENPGRNPLCNENAIEKQKYDDIIEKYFDKAE